MRGNFVRQYRCYDLAALVALHEPTLAEEHRNIQNKVLKVADLNATAVLLVNCDLLVNQFCLRLDIELVPVQVAIKKEVCIRISQDAH